MARRGFRITAKVEGEARVRADLKRLEKLNVDAAKKRVAKTAYAVQKRARQAAPVDQNELRSRIVVDIQQGGLQAYVRAQANHSAVVEKGRSPGSRMPPEEPIAAWLQRHGIDPAMQFPIRRKIAEQGIEPRPFMMPAWDAEKGAYESGLADDLRAATGKANK